MSTKTVTCVLITCDGCGEDYGDEDVTWHCEDRAQATNGEWTQDGDLDYCSDCTQRRACAASGGHVWGEWTEYQGSSWRDCTKCPEHEYVSGRVFAEIVESIDQEGATHA